MSMGRKRTKDHGLPPHMAKKGDAYYYVTAGKPRQWIALGKDYDLALRKWAEHECAAPPSAATFAVVAGLYMKSDALLRKASRTQKQNEGELKNLLPVFGDVPLDQIRSTYIRRYLDARQAPIRANREISLMSHIINWARERGYTDTPNPCLGVKRNVETGRDVYVEDEAYQAVMAKAPQELKDAMELAYLTGQRASDVLKIRRSDIKAGALHLTQNKTGKKLRIALVGELARLVDRLVAPREGVTSLYLLQVNGQHLTYKMLLDRFNKAAKDAGQSFQFRDLRAKAASDAGNLQDAKALLGHQSVTMTEHYTRDRKGDLVQPVGKL